MVNSVLNLKKPVARGIIWPLVEPRIRWVIKVFSGMDKESLYRGREGIVQGRKMVPIILKQERYRAGGGSGGTRSMVEKSVIVVDVIYRSPVTLVIVASTFVSQ